MTEWEGNGADGWDRKKQTKKSKTKKDMKVEKRRLVRKISSTLVRVTECVCGSELIDRSDQKRVRLVGC